MKATEDLRHEHQAVTRMLRVLEAVAVRPPAMDDVPALQESLDFLHVFVDACHHHKEEKILFPALTLAAPGSAEAVGKLRVEHDRDRELVALFGAHLDRAAAGAPLALGGVGGLLGQYAKMVRSHIESEDSGIFVLADESIPEPAQAELVEGYERVEREVIGEGRHEAFHALLDRLEAAYL